MPVTGDAPPLVTRDSSTREPGNADPGITTKSNWEKYGRDWVGRKPYSGWREHSDSVNSRLLEEWMPKGTSACTLKTDLFDEALTEGLYPILSARSSTVVGIDVAPAIAAEASRKFPSLHVVGADVRRLPLASCSFDVIVSLSTLDHFPDRDQIACGLVELHRVLKSGGTLIVTLDNLRNPVVAARNALPFWLTSALGLVPYPMGKTYGPSGISGAVIAAGFEIMELRGLMHSPRILAVPLLTAIGKASPVASRKLSRLLMSLELLQKLPTRFLTGYFVAIRACKAA